MARIRTIKPELLEDQRTATLNDAQWRLFVSLILLADDYGNLRAHPIQISGAVFWGSDPARPTKALLDKLQEVGLITLYEVSGQPYAHLNAWAKHQRVDHPGAPRCPGPGESDSRESRESLANDSREKSDPGEKPAADKDLASPRESLARDSRLIRSDQDLTPKGSEQDHTQSGAARWTALDWFDRFKGAWVLAYKALSYWGPTADNRATRDLEDALAQMAPTDALAAQERAAVMFSEFLAEDSRPIRQARHPWSWFVQRFNGLRVPQNAGGDPERDVRTGHHAAPAKTARAAGRKF